MAAEYINSSFREKKNWLLLTHQILRPNTLGSALRAEKNVFNAVISS